jgi:hypothetical protein
MSVSKDSEQERSKTVAKMGGSLEEDLPNAIHLLPMLINEGGDSVWGYGI